jgi:hypothetical protein
MSELCLLTASFTSKCQNDCLLNVNDQLFKVGSAYVCLSNTIQAVKHSGQGPVTFRMSGLDGLGLRIGLAGALSGELPLGVLA